MGLALAGVPHRAGGVQAAMEYLAPGSAPTREAKRARVPAKAGSGAA